MDFDKSLLIFYFLLPSRLLLYPDDIPAANASVAREEVDDLAVRLALEAGGGGGGGVY